jgi:hypothetical protein
MTFILIADSKPHGIVLLSGWLWEHENKTCHTWLVKVGNDQFIWLFWIP